MTLLTSYFVPLFISKDETPETFLGGVIVAIDSNWLILTLPSWLYILGKHA